MAAGLRDTWNKLQRAETLLVQAASKASPDLMPAFRQKTGLDPDVYPFLIRTVWGLDPDALTPQDYLTRYPFSSLPAIQAGFDRLVASGLAESNGDGSYAANASGKRIVRTWMDTVAEMVDAVDLGDLTTDDVERLIAFDHRILASLERAERPHGSTIFKNRLRGLRPDYSHPALWHHWQLVGTMLAAHEDEQEYVRQEAGMEPLSWFVRRQIWFAHRRPWLARALTLEALVARAAGYAPIENAEDACALAVQALKDRGWLMELDDEFRLTAAGLAVHDQAEEAIDEGFLFSWPQFSAEEAEELHTLVTRFNRHLEDLLADREEDEIQDHET